MPCPRRAFHRGGQFYQIMCLGATSLWMCQTFRASCTFRQAAKRRLVLPGLGLASRRTLRCPTERTQTCTPSPPPVGPVD